MIRTVTLTSYRVEQLWRTIRVIQDAERTLRGDLPQHPQRYELVDNLEDANAILSQLMKEISEV